MRLRKATAALTVLVISAALIRGGRPALADDIQAELDKAMERQQEVATQLKNAEGALATVYWEAEQIAVQLKVIEYDLAQARAHVSVLTEQLLDAQSRLAKAEEERAAAEERWRTRRTLLAHRVRAVHESPGISYLSVLLGSSDFGDMISRLDLMKAVVQKDAQIVDSVRSDKLLMEAREQEANQRRTQVQRLQTDAVAYEQTVAQKKEQQEMTAQALANQRVALQAQLEEYEAQAALVEEEIIEIQRRMARAAGRFAPISPVRGQVTLTSYFGPRFIFGGWSNHGGIDMAASTGDPVMAVEDGVVIHAGYDDLYGNRIVIDHGGGISTWYGHNSQLTVNVGDEVRQGQQIAKAGSTGLSTGPHVHLEIRIDGTRVDPLEYINL